MPPEGAPAKVEGHGEEPRRDMVLPMIYFGIDFTETMKENFRRLKALNSEEVDKRSVRTDR